MVGQEPGFVVARAFLMLLPSFSGYLDELGWRFSKIAGNKTNCRHTPLKISNGSLLSFVYLGLALGTQTSNHE
jgi:hypothetical protein